MKLKVLGPEPLISHLKVDELKEFCVTQNLNLTLEWVNGQLWLHSDEIKEKPIGIEIDRELQRHEDYFKRSSIHKELLARAIGIKGGHRPRILDLTGGMLGDTLLFLSFGCEVITLERHPLIRLLIESALENAHHGALSRLTFIPQDALTYLEHETMPEVIYFDPMFEDANEKANPKKEMRIFRRFVGKDQDARSVFQKAQAAGAKRLVVKRPRLSQNLGDKPDIVYEGKSTRYDVYLSQKHGTFGSNPLQ